MSPSTLSLTQFRVEKLRCMGGAGRASPYRITTYRGTALGALGAVAEYGWEARNDDCFDAGLGRVWRRLWNRPAPAGRRA